MKYKDPITGELKSITVKSGDTLPLGTIVEFDGTEVPDGYEEVSYEETGSMGNIVVDDITCKNLFDKTKEIKLNSNLDADGNISSNTGLFVQLYYIPVKPNTTYTISTANGNYKRIGQYDNSKTFISRLVSGASDTQYTFTTDSNCYYIRVACSITDLDSIQLEPGSVATEYTPYKKFSYNSTDSMGEIVVDDIIGKNLIPNEAKNKTISGITFTVNKDKSITISGTALGHADIYIKNAWGSTVPFITLNGEYTLSTGANNSNVVLYLVNGTTVVSSTSSKITQTFNNREITCVFLRVNSGSTVNATIYPQLEKGSVATNYVEYDSYSNNEAKEYADSLDAMNLKCVYKRTNWSNALVTSTVNVNAGDGGASYLISYTGHNSTGNATNVYLGLLRCGYNGNNYAIIEIAKNSGAGGIDISFNVDANGYLTHQNGASNGATNLAIYKLT